MIKQNDINGPWSLHFDRDGTEDIAIICDADGEELVRSRRFWLPEGDDPVPSILAAMHLMAVAPKLLLAAKATLTAFELILEVDGPEAFTRDHLDADPLATLKAAIVEAEAIGGLASAPRPFPRHRGHTSTTRTVLRRDRTASNPNSRHSRYSTMMATKCLTPMKTPITTYRRRTLALPLPPRGYWRRW